MKRGTLIGRVAAASVLSLVPAPAFAHHVMGGKTPGTFLDGLLSGFGHPVIEPVHLAAIVLAGVVAARLGGGLALVAAFAVGSFFGTLAGAWATLTIDETIVVATVAALALLLPFRFSALGWIGMAGFLAIGVVHGIAFAESVIGAETGVIGAYLLGLAASEIIVGGVAYLVASRLAAKRGGTT